MMTTESRLFGEVLLVEDEPAHVLLIERALRGLVSSITTCGTVGQARTQLESRAFDLVISDLNLPDMRSEDVVRSIRGSAPSAPIVVLTSSSTLSDAVSAMRAGASDFLVKNFDAHFSEVLQLLLSRLRSAVEADRERAEARRDRDLLQEAIENSKDGLAVAFRDGSIRYSNSGFSAFLKSFDVSSGMLLDISPARVVRGGEVLERLRERVRDLEPGSVWTTELVRADNPEVAFDLSISVSSDKSQDPVCVLWVRDVRERKRRERFQREILSTTTHDLKGPLGAIATSCDVLLDAPSDAHRTQALLERIASSANSAIHLIEEFLSVRRIEEGAFVMRPMPSQLVAAVSKVVESFRLTAKTREVHVAIDAVDEEILGRVDPLGFERVVSNLLSNAIKFSRKGGSVLVRLGRGGGGVVLSVTDEGPGLEPSEVQRLFNRYARLSAHSAVAGSGLGLFIVKCVVSAHGGSIDVTSVPGRGTTFEVFLPDAPPCNERGEVLCLDFA